MHANTLYLAVGALIAGLIGTSIWAYQEPPGMGLAQLRQGVMLADR